MLEDILAKSHPRETLIQHTENIISKWEELRRRYSSIILCNDKFWQQSFFSVLFHDFGKIAGNFQFNIHKSLTKENQLLLLRGKFIPGLSLDNNNNNIRHEFLSGLFLLYSNPDFYKKSPLVVMAIFSHHKPLVDTIFQDDRFKKLIINQDDIDKLISFCLEKAKTKKFPIVINPDLAQTFCSTSLEEHYSNFLKKWSFKSLFTELEQKDRRVYICYKAMLCIADWLASGDNKLPVNLEYDPISLKSKIIKKLKTENKIETSNAFEYKKFQLASLRNSSVLAIAPTGSGKTEAALLWASQKKSIEKIIFLLPTRVTSNAMYRRLKYYFGHNNTAVVHSSAYLTQKELDDGFNKFNYLQDKTFFKNITVCTIDQVLSIGFNVGYWEIKTFHLNNARIIIDEIHLYSPYTLGLIIATISYLSKECNALFYIMSATMPEKLKGLLSNTFRAIGSKFQVIEDNELLKDKRNKFFIKNCYVDELETEILEELNRKKKVLLVVNTVDEAIRLFRKFNMQHGYKTICYHSRFIQSDKVEKERQILSHNQQSILLIATQVVEVSLDIDFDILFSENAPIDAIVQRAGRVNRVGKKYGTKVIIFKHNEISEKIYDIANVMANTFESLLQRDGEELSNLELNELVNHVYRDVEIESSENYRDGLNSYEKVQRRLHYIKDNVNIDDVYTREGLDTINVIPSMFEEQLHNAELNEKAKYEIAINLRRFRMLESLEKSSKDKIHGWINYVDCEYNADIGFDLNIENESTMFT